LRSGKVDDAAYAELKAAAKERYREMKRQLGAGGGAEDSD
jgi:hypothetical protein